MLVRDVSTQLAENDPSGDFLNILGGGGRGRLSYVSGGLGFRGLGCRV